MVVPTMDKEIFTEEKILRRRGGEFMIVFRPC
jgi:hypothetical protein